MMLQRLSVFGGVLFLLFAFAAIPFGLRFAASSAFARSSSSSSSCLLIAKYDFSSRFTIHSGNGLFQSSGGLSRFVHVVLSKCACIRSSRRFISLLITASAASLFSNQLHLWQLLWSSRHWSQSRVSPYTKYCWKRPRRLLHSLYSPLYRSHDRICNAKSNNQLQLQPKTWNRMTYHPTEIF